MPLTACINEIFSSLQGEGPHAGHKMTFVRFSNCRLGCQWCDTDFRQNTHCSVYPEGSDTPTELIPNPTSIVKLYEILDQFDNDTVAITGGEPLEQADFLAQILPHIRQTRRVLLETNGIYHDALRRLVGHVDIISMDIKLPSSTGRGPFWNEHRKFIGVALKNGADLYVKLVVTSTTTDRDINEAIKLISNTNRHIPVILQPVTPTESFPSGISEGQVESFRRLFGVWLPNVSITPQMHKVWNVK